MAEPRGRRRPAWTEHRISDADDGKTVKQVLQRSMHVSGRMIQRLTRSDGLRLNGRPTFLKRTVKTGDVVSARVNPPEESDLRPVQMPLAIVHEDEDVLVIDKPAGLLVHPSRPSHIRTLAHGVAHHFERSGIRNRVRPVHRLDRNTTGLVLFAKTPHAHHQFDWQLRSGKFVRRYLAIVTGVLQEDGGRIDEPIGDHPTISHLRAVTPSGQPAVTGFQVRERLSAATLVEVELETGRTHQIRVHFAHIGHPLVGDVDYGGGHSDFARQALHAHHLEFTAPATGEKVSLMSPLPEDMEDVLIRLRGS